MQTTREQTQAVAQALVDVGAIRVAAHQPFFYTSGWASPVFVDISVLMAEVGLRKAVMDHAAQALRPVIERQRINAIVGSESSGIACAAWLAERLELPLSYLRKRPIGWGMSAQIEGKLPPEARVLLVDDVTTDGRSKADACQALRKCGAQVSDVFVLLHFDIYPETHALLASHQVVLHALLTWPQLYAAYAPSAPLSAPQKSSLEAFNRAPVDWSLKHGGVSA